MKRLIPFILLLMIVTSCKKDYECSCGFSQKPQIEMESVTFHDTRKQAQKKCDQREKELLSYTPDAFCNIIVY
ncbi:MAG: hypothetical protein V4635_06035 [Bacteroidota bacterium]